MRITDMTVSKQIVDGVPMLVCSCTTDDGNQFGASAPWVNEQGLWASKEDARNPAEIAAWLRNFAAAIDKYAGARAA